MRTMDSNVPCTCGGELKVYAHGSYSGASNLTANGFRKYCMCADCGLRWTVWYGVDGKETQRRLTRKRKKTIAPKAREPSAQKRNPPTLCWKCTNARANGCAWHRHGLPVAGWDAIEDKKYGQMTYTVIKCPEYAEERKKA